jgi:hypothetical protein
MKLNTSPAWKMQYDYLWVERKHTSFSDRKTYEEKKITKYQGSVAAMRLCSLPKCTGYDP